MKLGSLVSEKQSLRYEYDFGDSWEHNVLVEKRLEAEARLYYPLCIGGERACPPEDCGGPPGYYQDHNRARDGLSLLHHQ